MLLKALRFDDDVILNDGNPELPEGMEIDPIEEADRLACTIVKGRQYWSIRRKVSVRIMRVENE